MPYRLNALAELLSHELASKNHYRGIIAGLYRRFGVSSYNVIGQEHDADGLPVLEKWPRTTGG